MNHLRIYLLLILIFEFPVCLLAQSAGVSCSFLNDTVAIGNGHTFSNKIRFDNKTGRAITLVQSTTTQDILLRLPDTIALKAGTSIVFPVKYFASGALLANPLQQIKVAYVDRQSGQKVEAGFSIKIDQAQKILINLPEQIVYLNPATGLVNFKLHCANKGYSALTVKIKTFVNPLGLQIFTPNRNITLSAGADQFVEFKAKLLSNNTGYAPDFNVTIECTDDKGINLSTSVLRVTQLGSNRRQQTAFGGQYFNQLSNTVELSYSTMNKSYSFCSLRANGNLATGDSDRLSYNVNINYYNEQQALDAFDTWVSYKSKRFAITAGNLMENLDYSIFGRGVKSTLNLNSHNSVDLFYVRNTYLLFSQVINQFPGAAVFAGSYNYSNEGNTARVSLLYSHNPLTGIDTRFTNGNAHIRLRGSQKLDLRAGYSNEQLVATNQSKSGIAGGFIYTNHTRQFDMAFNNYYGSPYYSGLQRGAVVLDNLLNYHLSHKVGAFARYELIKNSPKYLVDTLTLAGYYNNTLRYETGININVKALSITLRPYLFKQDVSQSFDTTFIPIKQRLSSVAIRTGFDINYAIGSGQQLSAITDWGYVHSNNPALAKSRYMGFRVNANYFNRWWGMSVLVQNAPYYLSEELVSSYYKKQYYNYSFGPNIHYTSANGKVNLSVNDYLNFLSYGTKVNNALNAQVSYRFKGGLQVSGQVFYNSYPTYANSYNIQTRVGVSKQFMGTKAPGTNNLQLMFFEDVNNDGIFNNHDKVVDGLIINILPQANSVNGDLTTVTDKKGLVNYTNLRKDNYIISLIRGNGWHLGRVVNFNLTHNQKINVPLVKSGWLKGSITLTKQEYVNTRPNLEGIRVVATDDQNQSFFTLTNENGEFEFALPVNQYHLNLAIDQQKFSVDNRNQEVSVYQINNKPVSFNITDETHKVIIKQF